MRDILRVERKVAVPHEFGLTLLGMLGIDKTGVVSFSVHVEPRDIVRVVVVREVLEPEPSEWKRFAQTTENYDLVRR